MTNLWKELFGDEPFVIETLTPDIEEPEGTQRTKWQRYRQPGYVENGVVGYLDQIFRTGDPRSAREQLEDRYAHGGGFRPNKGFMVRNDGEALVFPGDPEDGEEDEVFLPIAWTVLDNGEHLILYEGTWLRILHTDGNYDIVRID